MNEIDELKTAIDMYKPTILLKIEARESIGEAVVTTGENKVVLSALKEKLHRLENPELSVETYRQIVGNISLERLKDICNAEREGRLVVLPCKVGQSVFKICKLYSGEKIIVGGTIRVCYICLHTEFYFAEPTGSHNIWFLLDDFGKTVFLTREEAEKALAEMEDDDEQN